MKEIEKTSPFVVHQYQVSVDLRQRDHRTSSPYFLTRLVLEEARNQLANKKQSMEEIASDLNFSDAYSFSKFFKKNTGKSPSVFRKEIMQIHTI